MQDKSNNQLGSYATKMIDLFSAESKRLNDPKPLKQFRILFEEFSVSYKKLGTSEHAIAMIALKKEMRLFKREFIKEIKTLINDFWLHKKNMKDFHDSQRQLESILRDFKSISPESYKISNPKGYLASSWKIPFHLLFMGFKSINVYMKYYFKLILFFIIKHSLIFFAYIVVAGLIYSESTNKILIKIQDIFSLNVVTYLILLVCFHAIQHYFIGPLIKKRILEFEGKELKKISFNLFLVRTMALYHKTILIK